MRYILTFPLLLFLLAIYLIRPIVLIRICSLPAKRIGHFVRNMDLYLTNQKKNDRYIDLFCEGKVISNYYFLKMLKKKITIIPYFFSSKLLRLHLFLTKYFKALEIHTLDINTIEHEYDYNNSIYKSKCFYTFNKEEIDKGKSFLRKLNLQDNEKYVCLCIRDSSYLKKFFPNKDYTYHDYRDHNIENFYLAANKLTELGYKVLRMGKTAEKKFDNGNKMIIDYASLDVNDDFYDFYLFANCEFVISTATGLDALGVLFRKPLLTCLSHFPFFETHSNKILNINRHHFSKKLNRNLKLSEMADFFKNKNLNIGLAENFLNQEIVFKDNTPEEWRDAALELIDRINNSPIKNDAEIQKKFWDRVKKTCKKIDLKEINQPYDYFIKKNIIEKEILGKISVSFLKKNEEWLS